MRNAYYYNLGRCINLERCIQDALNTAETGNALIEVARNAHKAEQELAALKRRLEEEFGGEVDINDHGGPNAAMRVMQIVRGEV